MQVQAQNLVQSAIKTTGFDWPLSAIALERPFGAGCSKPATFIHHFEDSQA